MAPFPEKGVPEEGPLPPSLRLLKSLVILLMLSMIGGVLAVVWLLVTRLPQAMEAGPALPEAITLPQGDLISHDYALFGRGDVPLHPGAEKYYQEQGLL